jgi:hypothetical protein
MKIAAKKREIRELHESLTKARSERLQRTFKLELREAWKELERLEQGRC